MNSGDILYCATRSNLPNRNLFVLRSTQSGLSLAQIASNAPTTTYADEDRQREDSNSANRKAPRPAYQNPIRLTEEHTYNGKWVQGGHGYAYIANINNAFFLAVRPENPAENTNLFTRGHIDRYTPTPSGDRLFAIATPHHGTPCGLWSMISKGGVSNSFVPEVASHLFMPGWRARNNLKSPPSTD